MLEKKQYIRKIEFVLTDEMINPSCHIEHSIEIMEDGVRINSSTHREVMGCEEALKMLQEMKVYVYP